VIFSTIELDYRHFRGDRNKHVAEIETYGHDSHIGATHAATATHLENNMYQSIVTKYLGPTNTLGSRIRATATAGAKKTVNFNYELGPTDNHRAAAQALAAELGWKGRWEGGSTSDGYVFVCIGGDGFTIA
jgi:hypothetical protein